MVDVDSFLANVDNFLAWIRLRNDSIKNYHMNYQLSYAAKIHQIPNGHQSSLTVIPSWVKYGSAL